MGVDVRPTPCVLQCAVHVACESSPLQDGSVPSEAQKLTTLAFSVTDPSAATRACRVWAPPNAQGIHFFQATSPFTSVRNLCLWVSRKIGAWAGDLEIDSLVFKQYCIQSKMTATPFVHPFWSPEPSTAAGLQRVYFQAAYLRVDWKALQRGLSCRWPVQARWVLLGGQKERQWVPGTGRTARRTMVGTAGSALYLQRIREVTYM